MQLVSLSTESLSTVSLSTESLSTGLSQAVLAIGQNPNSPLSPSGPMGADFGKASPIGLLVIVLMLIAVLIFGFDLMRRLRRFRARRSFAEKHNMDPFDIEAIDRAMAQEAGVEDEETFTAYQDSGVVEARRVTDYSEPEPNDEEPRRCP